MRSITLMAAATLASAPADAAPFAEVASGQDDDTSWQKLTSFRVSPDSPHQNDVIRILIHCPTQANHAVVGSTAFPIKGSWRMFREVGVGLGGLGFGKRGVVISRFAPPGEHEVRMKCVQVRADKLTGLRTVKVLSRSAVSLVVRPLRVGQFF
ncbi:hypothetical protein [Nonomuraea sp. WAC 01424]|uniref:hypothetical protein n=1 Tax=Nonomuraea sp. WAC 01424 TaxID=2203200 RepID=UPI00163CB8E5|nr:hypothetical protein [Nonomuraea sp. WAC 01424]